MAVQFIIARRPTNTCHSHMPIRHGTWDQNRARILPMCWPFQRKSVPIKSRSLGTSGMHMVVSNLAASQHVSMMCNLPKTSPGHVTIRRVRMAPSVPTMGTTFNASVAPDIMAPAANRSHPLAPIIHVKTVEHALLMGMTTNVNVHSCTLAPTANTVARHPPPISTSPTMCHSSARIAYASSTVPMERM